MKCNHCNDQGLIAITVQDYNHPVWDHPNLRCSSSFDNNGNTQLVIDCDCHKDNPVDHNDMICIVSDWMENGNIPFGNKFSYN